ncbi:ATP-binding cassette sub-family D member 4-like [Acanthaster planci]|uniref:ATP-binding cassette sub-family D member 4-like n=1 Tax=Acanthaster planci TaxID=133434 RepID=A0A8B7Y118_ACAPL|nr:ATP-binding cassette sub-family D member 4-like [Acanthaster planci]
MAILWRVQDSKAKKYRVDLLFIKRLAGIFRIFFPSLRSAHLALFLLLLLVSVGAEVAIYYVGLIPSEYNKVLPVKNLGGFIETTWKSMLYICLIALILSARTYISKMLYIHWREALSLFIHKLYFKNFHFYQLNVLKIDNIDNPDQRITQDVERLCNQFSSIVPLLIVSPFTITFYSYSAWAATGYIGPISIYLYFIVGTIINTFLMAPVVERTYRQEKLEGAYRFKHVQIRSNAEAAAFYVASHVEREKTNKKLKRLIDTQSNLINFDFWLQVSMNLFDYIGSILSYVAIAVPIFAGAYDKLDSDELYSLISKNSFVCMYLIHCFSQLIDLSNKVTEIAGYSHRIGELIESLKMLSDGDTQQHQDRDRSGAGGLITRIKYRSVQVPDRQGLLGDTKERTWHELQDSGDESGSEVSTPGDRVAYKLDQVSVATPDGKEVLIKDLSLEIRVGYNLLISGPTGSGKTSILRVLRGLFRTFAGTVAVDKGLTPDDVMFVPQKPFQTDGTLKEQVIYPQRISTLENPFDVDRKIMEILDRVGLLHLYERIGSLDKDVDWDWSDVLTPGEMQCLSFARLFYTKPSFAFLDEATSALTLQQQTRFYTHCKSLGITLISVGHRESLKHFHDAQLVVLGDGCWSLKDVVEEG